MGIRKFTKDERVYFRQKVIDTLLAQSIFKEFKYIKSQDIIIKKTKFGYQKVAMYFNWEFYDIGKQEFTGTIMNIAYSVRFSVLHKWFEKYSVKRLSTQRGTYGIGRTASMLGFKDPYILDRYDIVYSGEEFNDNMEKMVKDMVEIATYFFDKYRSLEDLYEALIVPVLEGKKKLPDVGADWIFEYLTLTKLIDSENYERVKELIVVREKWMNHEPNIIRYKDKLDEIFEYLEALELEMPPAFPPL